jgi:outer membrane immunogenic protein
MTNRLLIGAAAAALTVAGAFTAQAADLPTRKGPPPAPVFVPPPFTWTGFYIGANAGGVWSTSNLDTTFYAAGFPILNNVSSGRLSTSNTGFIGGGQAGYNWQSGAAVFGIETDFDGTSLSRNRNLVGANFLAANGATDFFSTDGSARLNWLGTTRGRIGFVATPDNRLMFYGTGGVAYGGASSHVTLFDNDFGWGWNGSRSNTRVGWTLGGGVEYAITNNITIKGEYLYYNLGSTNAITTPNFVTATAFPNTFLTGKVTFQGSILRAGVNYKF